MSRNVKIRLARAAQNLPATEVDRAQLAAATAGARIAYKTARPLWHIGWGSFVLAQSRFLGRGIWLAQTMVFLFECLALQVLYFGGPATLPPGTILPVLSVCAIAAALVGVPAMARSFRYKMAETELATRVSLPRLLLTRLGLVILINGLTLCFLRSALALLAALAGSQMPGVAVYLALPYLAACFGCVAIVNHSRGRLNGFACTAYCALLGFVFLGLYEILPSIYEAAARGVWATLCGVCLVLLAAEVLALCRRMHKFDGLTA